MRARLDKRPSIERLRQVVAYDPETGVFTWLITSGRAIAGQEAGVRVDKHDGYRRIRIDKNLILAHHVAFALALGRWPVQLDHRDGDKANCQITNLRESTQSQNMANQGRPATNKSGFKGVYFHKVTSKWAAQIGKRHIGLYDAPELAAAAYEEAAVEAYGEFARGVDFVKPQTQQPKVPAVRRTSGLPTPDEVRSALSYDQEIGVLRWGVHGPVAGMTTRDGYVRVGLFRRHYYAHVLAWVIMKSEWPIFVIHHVDANRSNNRWENLEQITQSDNILEFYRDMGQDRATLYKRMIRTY